ncbi:MAG: UDP-N-acetylmuramoyl-L-alanyl-D-glutamate--2,6-diaminopimelate ligase [Candidatus Parcubacteria bacterium]|nr:UDP-N-acetylmuramoyl-L-alanyl-D-glutamate--2,6-diaminopimelate ligase [Candidatus Parcubacteria bacterium]
MPNIKKIKRLIVTPYHYLVPPISSLIYGRPSNKMVVIGITGTKGKTSAANYIWSVLTASGHKTGLIGTANIRIGQEETMNPYHMTMPGRAIIQGLLKKMLTSSCEYAIVETTSEGIKQWRHKAINYDVAIFTNLSPEHLDAHGNFENYKKAKGQLFAVLENLPHKTLKGTKIFKTIIANIDDKEANYFLNFKADKKITFGIQNAADVKAEGVKVLPFSNEFTVNGINYKINLPGEFNVYNALVAIAVARNFDLPQSAVEKGLAELYTIPGRMEQINSGQNFIVLVDYAHEEKSMTAALQAARVMTKEKIIVLLGAEGGGRDKAKRPAMGRVTGELADYVVVSNVDPYKDDPQEIIEDIAKASELTGKVEGKDLFRVIDRREGIKMALSLANKDDVVLITGKGAEQFIIINGVRSPWDDRRVVKEELERIK